MKLMINILLSLLICSILTEVVKGDLSGSLADLDKAIKLRPNSVDAYIRRGELRYKQGDPNGALTDYRKAIELKTDLVPAPDLVASPDFTVTNDIGLKAIALIQVKNYEKLDELAEQYRSSKECYADGVWKLSSVYDALIPSYYAPDDDWDARLDTIAKWMAARPDSIAARLAWANALVAYAWKARGGGVTDTVSPEGWRLFFKRLAEAEKTLKDPKFVVDECPIYWRVMMTDALGLQMPRPQFDALFERAKRQEKECETYYYRRAIYLLPQWYGTNGEWQCDLAKSADKIGGENGDLLYAQVVWNIHQRYGGNPFMSCNVSWARVDKGFEVIEKRFPDSLAAKIERVELAILPNDLKAFAYCDRGYDKQSKHEWATAISDYNQAIVFKTNYANAYSHRGFAKKGLGDLPGAMADFNIALAIDPKSSGTYYNRAMTEKAMADNDRELADLNKAIELDTNYMRAYFERGMVKHKIGDHEGGTADIQKFMELQSSGK